MITFKQFLFEYNFNHDEYEDTYGHEDHVHGHLVGTRFEREKHKSGEHYTADFNVNNSYNHKGGDKKTNQHILHHVGNVVHSFIKYRQPDSINLSAMDDNEQHKQRKVKFYQKAAEHYVKRNGGKFIHHNNGSRVHIGY